MFSVVALSISLSSLLCKIFEAAFWVFAAWVITSSSTYAVIRQSRGCRPGLFSAAAYMTQRIGESGDP